MYSFNLVSVLFFSAYTSAGPSSDVLILSEAEMKSPIAIHTTDGEFAGPLVSCGTSDDSFTIKDIVINPYPIQIGQNVTVRVTGDLAETVVNGSTATVKVSWAGVTVVDETYDLCKVSGENGYPCPIEKGPITIEITKEVPTDAPAVTVKVTANVLNALSVGGKRVACVTGRVQLQ